jgi:hypothetical protein
MQLQLQPQAQQIPTPSLQQLILIAQGVEQVMQLNLELEEQMVQEIHEQLLFLYTLNPEADPQFRELLQRHLEENIQRCLVFRQRRSQRVDRSLEMIQRWGADNQEQQRQDQQWITHQQWLQRQQWEQQHQQWQEQQRQQQQRQQHQQQQQQGQRSELRTQVQQQSQPQLPGPPLR